MWFRVIFKMIKYNLMNDKTIFYFSFLQFFREKNHRVHLHFGKYFENKHGDPHIFYHFQIVYGISAPYEKFKEIIIVSFQNIYLYMKFYIGNQIIYGPSSYVLSPIFDILSINFIWFSLFVIFAWWSMIIEQNKLGKCRIYP
jgi:hypothetical protein